ncbi:hypothetical protein [Staphylothermus hellenicus]|uniref:Uncharacterized protein n=1 Tax=Staphylothermus hellenicus (strain DSM 12710 / JCM 10830 / BK20S6-10-b1 / P8) TaxID=591019 RepID=D7DB39_STAHD|nr:hypothetical protein [Staphylothermus hellenicus]ADI31386.1 hypothetical protein Shell_0247 [Staphylothermus hellenicus DSM 12710]
MLRNNKGIIAIIFIEILLDYFFKATKTRYIDEYYTINNECLLKSKVELVESWIEMIIYENR